MSESYSVKAVLTADVNNFVSGMGMAKQSLETLKMGEANLSNIGKMAGVAGKGLTMGLTVPLAGIGAMSLKTFGTFESQMNRVKAISGATGGEFEKLKGQAMELGAATIFSATEVAQAQEQMASAGFTTNEIYGAMPGVMNLAAVSGKDMALAGESVASAMRQFGIDGTKAGHVADVYARAAADTNAETRDMSEAMKYAGPVAGSLGISLEETAAAIGIMSNEGIKGSMAGMTLRTALARLATPTAKAKTLMKDLGLEFFDAQGKMKPMNEMIPMLQESFKGLTDQQKQQAIETLFGKTAMSGMLALVNSAPGEFDNLTNSLINSNGAAQEMADIMNSGLAGAIEQLKGSLETAGITIGKILSNMAIGVIGFVQGIIDGFNSLSPAAQKLIVQFGLVAAAIGPLLLIFSKLVPIFTGLSTAISTVGPAFAGFKAILAGTATPIGLFGKGLVAVKAAFAGLGIPIAGVVAALAVLGAAFVTLWNTNSKFRTQITTIWNQIKSVITDTITAIASRFSVFGEKFQTLIAALQPVWTAFCNMLAPVFTASFQLVLAAFEMISGLLIGLLDVFIGLFTGNWSQAWQGLATIVTTVWTTIQNVVNIGLNALIGIMQGAWELIKTAATAAWEAITSTITSKLTALGQAIQSAWDSIKSVANTVWSAISQVVQQKVTEIVTNVQNNFNKIKTSITEAWNNIKSKTTEAWNNIKTSVTQAVQSIAQDVSTKFNEIKTKVTEVMNNIKQTIQTKFNEAKTAATQAVNQIKTEVSNKFNEIKQKVTEVMNNIKQAIQSKFNEAKTAATNAVNQIKSAITDAFNQMVSTITSKMQQVVSSVRSGFSNAISAARSFIGQAVSVGANLVAGFVRGVMSKAASLASAAANVVKRAIGAAKAAAGIHSPSRVMAEVGRYFVAGGVVGINKEASSMEKASANLMHGVVNAFGNPTLDIASNLQNLKGSIGSKVDYSVRDNLGQPKPAYINLSLGNRHFKAFVEDISNVQGVEANLEEAFGF